MADYITSFTMKDGTKKQYDYNALANKPASVQSELSDTDGGYGQRVKALEDALDRNGYLYHGRVQELANGARKGGLKF